MRYLESILYGVSILFVGAYLVLLGMMLFRDKGRRTLMLAVRSLWLHKVRTFLSILGIIISTAAVIALIAFSEGCTEDDLEDIKRWGATNIIVKSKKPPDELSTQNRTYVARYGITSHDCESFATIPSVVRMVPMRVFPKPVYHGQFMHNSNIVA